MRYLYRVRVTDVTISLTSVTEVNVWKERVPKGTDSWNEFLFKKRYDNEFLFIKKESEN